MSAELSDAEMTAYRSHRDTFFNRVVPVSKNTGDPMDLYTFFINSYKETPREKLLELMDGAPDIEELRKLPDDELRYAYAERLTRRAIQDKQE